MSLRSPHENLQCLRAILRKVEWTGDPGKDAAAVTELKRILLKRIAELEAAEDRTRADAKVAGSKKTIDTTHLDKEPWLYSWRGQFVARQTALNHLVNPFLK